MTPNKPGQLAKFHTPLPDENPTRLYVVLEIIEDVERPRADIKALNTGLLFPPINTVLLDELVVVEVETTDLVGHEVTINIDNYTQVTGKVVKVCKQKIMPELSKGLKEVETNVVLTIQDENGNEHTGSLLVN